MSKKYEHEHEIETLVEKFETGTVSEAEWRHAEHLVVGVFYLSHHDFEIALEKMRDGIFNLLRAFHVDLSKEMPFHETLTVFWMRAIDDFRRAKNGASILETTNELIEKFDKDYPLRFYSRELLFSERARAEFVEPDLQQTIAAK